MKNNIGFVLFLLLLFSFSRVSATPDPPVTEGKAIFTSRCASCHNVHKTLTGPALAGVDERRSIDWIVNFVHSSQSMVKKGDKDAVAVFEKFNKMPMPDHPDLTSDHIKSIVEFIKAEAKSGAGEKAPFAKPVMKKESYVPISWSRDFWPFMGILGAIALLVIVLLFAAKVMQLKAELVTARQKRQ